MEHAPSDLSKLSPAELERLAHVHLDGLFSELNAAWTHVHETYAPAQVARRHPVATVAVAATAGLLLARALRRKAAVAPQPASDTKSHWLGRAILGLAGAAATHVLPTILKAVKARQSPSEP